MLNSTTEKLLSKIIAVGAGLTTVFLVSGSVTDPVNAPKLVILGISACSAIGLIAVSGNKWVIQTNKLTWVLSGLFLASAVISVFSSSSPLSQNVYGSYGRNNGLLTYLFLLALMISSAALGRKESHAKIVNWLIIAGLVNVVYCLWVIVFGDFIGWDNPYGNILGTLGNPNFIGSFLGIFLAAYVGYGLSVTAPTWFKYTMLLVVPITAFEIYDSSAIQGRVVGLSGAVIIGFFLVRSRFNATYLWIYSGTATALGLVSVLGALQIGPLTSIVYKASVSLRGQYWLAGWNSGNANPVTGVGMDSFGDWYRRTRDAHALELPGVDTVVNAAHNVPLDMFAFGGWPLFITYLLIVGWSAVALVRTILRSKKYDPILVVLTTSWFGYQLQSLISINQIGLAVWGWVLIGATISYERITREQVVDPKQVMRGKTARGLRNAESLHIRALLASGVFGLVGLVLALPPFTADSKWRSAQLARSVPLLEESMNPNYFNPQNSLKYMTNIQTLEQSNFPDLARKYALEAVNWNPDVFELWKLVYLIRNSSAEEKALALENMKRLDPLNPDVTSIK